MLFWAVKFAQLLLIGPLIWLALRLRTPLLASVRSELLWLIPIALLLLLWLNRPQFRARSAPCWRYWARRLLLILCVSGLAIALTTEGQYRLAKRRVLNSDTTQLAKLGQHLVVGYRDFAEVQTLVERKAIGGIFVTHHNLEGQSMAELSAQIASLQAIRQAQNLPPLWIATIRKAGSFRGYHRL